MKTVLSVIGTRPEAIKMCPVAKALRESGEEIRAPICLTGQHPEMPQEVLSAFGLSADFTLAVMREGQSLSSLTERILHDLSPLLHDLRPDAVLVHGDTTTAFAASLACFYLGIPIGHVEAGLRTYDTRNPFPEEFNRRAISPIATWHFAPTVPAHDNLLREGIAQSRVHVTGNTVIDALHMTVRSDFSHPLLEATEGTRRLFLTLHRRENRGAPMRAILRGIRRILDAHRDVTVLCPLHPNPEVRAVVCDELSACERVFLCEPLSLVDCHNILSRSYLILTDSGGLQEEGPALGKPVLILRNTTERPEGISAGVCRLVGTTESSVFRGADALLCDPSLYAAMAHTTSPYGDGRAALRIADVILREVL